MSPAPGVLKPVRRLYAALCRWAEDPYVRCAYFAVVAVAAMWRILGDANLLNDFPDAQYNQLYEEVPRLTVVRFHELPLWNPYYCGGIVDIATPSARFVSPTFLLTLLFGTFRGEALTVTLMTFLGLEGAFRYVRSRGGGALAAMTAAPIFALSGLFPRSEVLGWPNFFGFELVPWTLYGVRLAMRGSRRGVVLAAITVAWMIGFGGTYSGPLTVLAALFEVGWASLRGLRKPRALAVLVRSGILVILLSAAIATVRLWPIGEMLTASPRILGGQPAFAPPAIWEYLFGRRPWGFHRDDFLVGLPILPLLALGVTRKRAAPFTVAALLSLWLALGYGAPLSIFSVLRTIPPFTMLRSPERFLVFFALAAAGVAAVGVRRLEVAARRQPAFVVAALGCHTLLLFDTGILVRDAWVHARGRQVVAAPAASHEEFRQTRGNRWLADYYPFLDRGSLTCFDDYNVAQSPDLRGDLPAEEYLRDASAGTVTREAWSPDRIELGVRLTRPARVYVNQNWHPGWRASEGAVVSDDGLLAVDLPAGDHDVVLRFLPRSAVGGLGTSLAGLLVAAVLLWRARRDDGSESLGAWTRTAALSASPFLVLLLTLALMREPRRPPLPRVTPAGEPMVVDAPPPGTVPVGARWAEGVTLEAGRVEATPRADGHGIYAVVELDWRIDRKPPPGLGVFVRIEKPDGPNVGADHVLLSSVLLPEDAPLHATIRDFAERVTLPPSEPGTVWTVRAGLWRARRDATRLPPEDPGPRPPKDSAVFVTEIVTPGEPDSAP